MKLNLFKLTDCDLAALAAGVPAEIKRRALAATATAGTEIVNLEIAKRALIVALAGSHSILFVGREAAGKTMLRSLAASFRHTDTFEIRPCPCGNHGDVHRPCHCTNRQFTAHRKKWPVTDILCEVIPPREYDFKSGDRWTGAKEIKAQLERRGPLPEQFDKCAEQLLKYATNEFGLRIPTVDAIRRVARTVAALDRSSIVTSSHMNEAVNYRNPQ